MSLPIRLDAREGWRRILDRVLDCPDQRCILDFAIANPSVSSKRRTSLK
jgi:hypothetical protein